MGTEPQSLYDVIDYFFDKLNLRVEMTQEQVIGFVQQLSQKIVTYTIITNMITMLFNICLIIAIAILVKKVLKNKKLIDKMDKHDKCIKYIFIIVMLFILSIAIGYLIASIVKIILCLTFPEKIILEFINKYI